MPLARLAGVSRMCKLSACERRHRRVHCKQNMRHSTNVLTRDHSTCHMSQVQTAYERIDCVSRLEEAKEAGALELGQLRGQWKARLSEADAAHAEEAHALQRQMRQALKDARGQAEDDLAAAHRYPFLVFC